MNNKRRIFLICIGLVLVAGCIILTFPLALSRYYQARGGGLLNYAVAATEQKSASTAVFECDPQIDSNPPGKPSLIKAVGYLERAAQYSPRDAQTYLLFGRAYCWLGEADKAIQAYLTYTNLRPKNPLGYLELGYAYMASCNKTENISAPFPVNHEVIGLNVLCIQNGNDGKIKQAWKSAEIDTRRFLTEANAYFERKDYLQAEKSYRFAFSIYGQLEVPDIFKWGVAGSVAGKPILKEAYSTLPVYFLEDKLRVEVEEMRWLRSIPEWGLQYGDKVKGFFLNDSTFGLLYWGGEVVSFVYVAEAGEYQMIVRARNMPPAPTLLQLEDNFISIGKIELTREDKSDQEFSFHVSLTPGVHLISLNFLNNAIANGLDRDAYVDWVQIEKLPVN